jgi:chemotaxis protein methyltransferase CheR
MTTMTTTTAASTGMSGGSSMTTHQFDFLRDLVRRESAIVLEAGKEYLIESRLAPIARREGMSTVGELVQRLVTSPAHPLRNVVIDAMTTNETSFFRDVHPWQTLREKILPELIEARRNVRRLQIWCGAASSGQEPYSLAMLIHDAFPDVASNWSVTITATDLSESMVTRCGEARFSQLEVNRGLPAAMLMRYFRREGADWRLDEGIRRMVDVRTANLVVPSSLPRGTGFDLVMLRNVLIYFDGATKDRILADAHGRMKADGVLMLGSAEITAGSAPKFARHQHGRTIFFRPS